LANWFVPSLIHVYCIRTEGGASGAGGAAVGIWAEGMPGSTATRYLDPAVEIRDVFIGVMSEKDCT
jgi:hypothetical protein